MAMTVAMVVPVLLLLPRFGRTLVAGVSVLVAVAVVVRHPPAPEWPWGKRMKNRMTMAAT